MFVWVTFSVTVGGAAANCTIGLPFPVASPAALPVGILMRPGSVPMDSVFTAAGSISTVATTFSPSPPVTTYSLAMMIPAY